jgi:hypothetical protein
MKEAVFVSWICRKLIDLQILGSRKHLRKKTETKKQTAFISWKLRSRRHLRNKKEKKKQTVFISWKLRSTMKSRKKNEKKKHFIS